MRLKKNITRWEISREEKKMVASRTEGALRKTPSLCSSPPLLFGLQNERLFVEKTIEKNALYK